MSDTLDQAFEAMRRMTPATRESMAQAILTLANGSEPLDVEDEHLPALLEGLAQLERGEGIVGDPDALVVAAFAPPPTLKLRLSPRAEDDLDRIAAYLEPRDPLRPPV